MILKSFVVFLPALIGGFGFVHLFWKNDSSLALGLKMSLGIGVGLGMTSCLYFLRLLFFPGQGGYLLIEIVFLALVFGGLFLKKRISFHISFLPLTPIQILLGLAVVLLGAIALYFLVVYARLVPHGDYDAQAIWNLRARFIYRLGNAWQNAFSPLINRDFHMDYPLLVPLSVVGGWNSLGGEVPRVPSMLSMLFFFGMAGTIYFIIAYLRSTSQAAIAAILLLATPGLLLFSTFQTADIPLTYFFLAAVSLFILAGNKHDRNLFFLAGMTAGLSAWTKNEGLSFVVLMVICTIFVFGIRQFRTNLPGFLLGIAFPLLIVTLFKALISVNNDLFTDNGFQAIFIKLITPTRYILIAKHLITELIHLGSWPISIILVLFVYGLILGLHRTNTVTEKMAWFIPASQFAIYILIYVITPHDLEWHLNYSLSRLLIHLFPSVLLLFFLSVNPPETVLNKVK